MDDGTDDPAGVDATELAKLALRRARIASRAAMGDAERARARADIRRLVLDPQTASGVRGMDCVAAYVPLRTEPGSVELLSALRARGLRVLVPVTLPDRDLDWAEWSDEAIGPALGRDAIAAAQLVLVPAFAVDDAGMRLGRGGGSYDRALPRCAADAVTAALLFDGERVPTVPAQPWDRAVRAVVTPAGWADVHR